MDQNSNPREGVFNYNKIRLFRYYLSDLKGVPNSGKYTPNWGNRKTLKDYESFKIILTTGGNGV